MAKTVIRCKITRDGGSKASIGGVEYHFKPRPDLGAASAHVAVVENKEHINRFLRISEGYELFLGEDDADAPAAVAPAVPDDEPPAPEPVSEPEQPATDDSGDEDHEVDVNAPLHEQPDETLRAIYRALNHGKAAGPRTRRETLIEKIEEIREAQEG
jgi:hypothetical protein